MKLHKLTPLFIASIAAMNLVTLCNSQTITPNLVNAGQNYGASLVGTWRYSGGDLSAQQTITLELRSDGTYTKTLDSNVQGARYGGTHSGTWNANGTVVHLSGDGKWPPYSHDLARFTRIG